MPFSPNQQYLLYNIPLYYEASKLQRLDRAKTSSALFPLFQSHLFHMRPDPGRGGQSELVSCINWGAPHLHNSQLVINENMPVSLYICLWNWIALRLYGYKAVWMYECLTVWLYTFMSVCMLKLCHYMAVWLWIYDLGGSIAQHNHASGKSCLWSGTRIREVLPLNQFTIPGIDQRPDVLNILSLPS